MFTGFDLKTTDLTETSVQYRVGGDGPPVLLLHGFPQTHACWHQVAPELSKTHTVVVPDLRGYGGSSPARQDSVAAYGKRAMAKDQLELMEALGHDRFSVVGHDRGGRVGYRLALDHPERVDKLVALDIVPTADMWAAAAGEPEEKLEDWHWNVLSRPEPEPENRLTPDYLFPDGSPSISPHEIALDPDALADYLSALDRPSVRHAMCQDYRAGATVDRELDEQDLAAGRTIECPVLVLWGSAGDLPQWFDPMQTWSRWAPNLQGEGLGCGHFIPEESPKTLLDRLTTFLDA
ncbi:alpha/beta hydrolase fold protein [Kribbella flavida DSM 17836]|uniref:Alpha/beta hydrolase fold protein n=2 Tax=Kribbella flavida TaxID=182640 RepID=D2Q3L3_KRIFD|nr:alpha/beta hydrolase fold protein [Kribbella flavida DSM 17836]